MLRSRWGRTSRKLRNCILISVNRILYSKWLSMPFRQMKICLQNTILKRGSVLIRFWGPDGLEAQSCPQLEWLCSYCFFFCPILDSTRLIWSLCAITLLLTCWRRLPSIIETFDSDIFGLEAGCKFLSVQVFNHYFWHNISWKHNDVFWTLAGTLCWIICHLIHCLSVQQIIFK